MNWHVYDTWFVLTGGIAAMACAVPGVWLVLRRQSLMGDALSHTALPGIVVSFLFGQWLLKSGTIATSALPFFESILLVVISVAVGVGTAVLTELLQRTGRVESSAALGVVFTSLFALGLFLVRLLADHTDLDAECVLFGHLELVVLDTVWIGSFEIPRACLTNGATLLLNLGLVWLFFKELQVSAFDPAMANSLGIRSRWIHYGTMSVTALTVLTAFQTVGSIIVVGLLVVPAATALLLTERLPRVILLSMIVAAASALVGHMLAKTLPMRIFVPLGLTNVQDAGTSGMIAATAGAVFLTALLVAPQKGLLAKGLTQLQLSLKMAGDDVLGALYRLEETPGRDLGEPHEYPTSASWLTRWYLRIRRLTTETASGPVLTSSGRAEAKKLVRAHRLWESYMQKHFELPEDHLHAPAHLVEHFLDEELQEKLFRELDAPANDPHGRNIPAGATSSPKADGAPAENSGDTNSGR
ncbi:MAG: metal ABC transporter permease [Planctomycetaceae bacterium]|nr:metal ABC transporter permease [Planctomycetaceae bacterium]MCB9953686.1 metal ABC transporter permease [Planctomycetaceae bacterium]